MQGSVESGQSPRPPKCPRHLDGSPSRRGRKPTGYMLQRRPHSLMNDQTSRRSQPHARIENVNGSGVLEIEAIQGRSRAHARHSALPHEHVESTESTDEVWLRSGVNAVPDANQAAVIDLCAQLIACHYSEQLPSGREAAEFSQQRQRGWLHYEIIDGGQRSIRRDQGRLGMSSRLW